MAMRYTLVALVFAITRRDERLGRGPKLEARVFVALEVALALVMLIVAAPITHRPSTTMPIDFLALLAHMAATSALAAVHVVVGYLIIARSHVASTSGRMCVETMIVFDSPIRRIRSRTSTI